MIDERREAVPADAPPLATPLGSHFARRCQRELKASLPHQTAQLTQIRKVRGCSIAVEQPRPAGDASDLDVLDHRSHRRDAGAAGDEQEPALVRP